MLIGYHFKELLEIVDHSVFLFVAEEHVALVTPAFGNGAIRAMHGCRAKFSIRNELNLLAALRNLAHSLCRCLLLDLKRMVSLDS